MFWADDGGSNAWVCLENTNKSQEEGELCIYMFLGSTPIF